MTKANKKQTKKLFHLLVSGCKKKQLLHYERAIVYTDFKETKPLTLKWLKKISNWVPGDFILVRLRITVILSYPKKNGRY